MVQVKFFFGDFKDIEDEINEFLSQNNDSKKFKVIDIKFQSSYINHSEDTWEIAMLIYECSEI